jgi:sucrose-6-phosphate hydrolase SacC (GH32 family)
MDFMEKEQDINVSRRSFLAASAGLLLPQLSWAESSWKSIRCWKLDGHGDTAHEETSGADDSIASRTGHAIWVGSGRNRALRLDGYSVWINQITSLPAFHGEAVTVSAWVALESYPVDEADLVQLDSRPDGEFHFSIDRLGFLQFGMIQGKTKNFCRSTDPIPKARWTHLAASVGPSGTTVYRDGFPCGHSPVSSNKLEFAKDVKITLGKSTDCPVVAGVFPTGVLNGLLRDVCIFDGELSRNAIAARMEDSKPDLPPDLQINASWCVSDPHRPICHAQPPRAWTNEPHGLIHWRGQYHLFYQKNPNGPYWGHIHWGHMTSPDLLAWTEMPVALTPEPGADAEGCWSGSVTEFEGKLAIIYTGGDGKRASICLALSEDGIHFTKHPGNPIIPEPPQGHGFPEFRDPFVWREGGFYYLMIGSAVKDVGGTALLYRSQNLVNWEYRKQLYSGSHKDSGVFWEMPIFVKTGDFHALIVCEVPGRASYWVGTWKDETFTPVSDTPRRLELFNHTLSPTPMVDKNGEIVAMGIIPDERHSKATWAAGWAHLYSLPRVFSADASGLLRQHPHDSIEQWCKPLQSIPEIHLNGAGVQAIDGITEKSLRIRATFRRGDSTSVSLFVRRSPDGKEQTEIRYTWQVAQLTLNRTQSSLDPLGDRAAHSVDYTVAEKDSIHLDVFVDRSILEVYVDNQATFSAGIYPSLDQSDGVGFAASGSGARVETICVERLVRSA